MNPVFVHRDRWMAVAHKPPGMPVQPTRTSSEGTLEAWARAQPDVDYVALHHRLDGAAQGLVAMALHRDANKGLARVFRERLADRRYRVLVHGVPESESGRWEHREGREGTRRVALGAGEGSGRPMSSTWRVLEQRGPRALLEVRLHTGRTHQIRLQAEAAGWPVVGDRVYGFGERGGLRLQAWSLHMDHPVTDEPLRFELPEPDDW